MALSSSFTSASSGRSPSQLKPMWRLSIERMALPRDSWKLPASAIASPTDFIDVVRLGSAPGNFSNANRGTLVTT